MTYEVTGPELTPQGFCVSWRSSVMPAPAFEYFYQRQQARDFAASFNGGMTPEQYRTRWPSNNHFLNRS